MFVYYNQKVELMQLDKLVIMHPFLVISSSRAIEVQKTHCCCLTLVSLFRLATRSQYPFISVKPHIFLSNFLYISKKWVFLMKKSIREVSAVADYGSKIIESIRQRGEVSLYELYKKKITPSHQTTNRNLRILCKEGKIRTFLKISPEILQVFHKPNEVFFTMINNYDSPHKVLDLINTMCGSDISVSSQAMSDFIDLYIKKAEDTVSYETKRYMDSWKRTNSDRLSKGIKLYDENISRYEIEDAYLYTDKKGLTREDYIENIKENIERAFQYNTQKFDSTRDSKTFKLVEPQKYIEELEKRKYKENAEIIAHSAKRLAYALMSGMFNEKEKVAFSLTYKNKDGDYDIIGMDAMGQIKLCRRLVSKSYEPPTTEKTIFEHL